MRRWHVALMDYEGYSIGLIFPDARLPGSISARKVVYANNEWIITNSNSNSNSNSKGPSRSTSATNLKKRSNSTNAVNMGTIPLSAASLNRRNDKMF